MKNQSENAAGKGRTASRGRAAVIGLGSMGSGMALSLLRAGFDVCGYDTNAAAMERLAAQGGRTAATPAEAAKGADFIVSVVNSVDQLPDDVQVQANRYVTTFEHPSFGPTQVVGIPVGLSETPGQLRRPAPEFGQHTEEILRELGLSPND